MPNPTSHRKLQTFNILQAGRFFAASVVVTFHTYLLVGRHDRHPFNAVFDFGYLGVDFFFVLSGFIMVYIHWYDIGKKSRLKNFIIRRFIRIYPLYLVTFIAVACLMIMIPTFGVPTFREPLFILINLFSLPTIGEPIIGISWSLQHEIVFYALFAMFIGYPRIGGILLGTWFVASISAAPQLTGPLSWICDARHVEFLFGMIGAYLIKTNVIPHPRLVFIFGLTMLCAIAVVSDVLHLGSHDTTLTDRIPLYLPTGLASLILIVGGVECERQNLMKVPQVFGPLGDISYALYLTHFYTLEILEKSARNLNILIFIPAEIFAVVCFIASISVAAAVHYWIERPLIEIFKLLFERKLIREIALAIRNR